MYYFAFFYKFVLIAKMDQQISRELLHFHVSVCRPQAMVAWTIFVKRTFKRRIFFTKEIFNRKKLTWRDVVRMFRADKHIF